MDRKAFESATKLNQDIATLEKIKSALDGFNRAAAVNVQAFSRTIEELASVTSVTPILDHAKCLTEAALIEKKTAFDNL